MNYMSPPKAQFRFKMKQGACTVYASDCICIININIHKMDKSLRGRSREFYILYVRSSLHKDKNYKCIIIHWCILNALQMMSWYTCEMQAVRWQNTVYNYSMPNFNQWLKDIKSVWTVQDRTGPVDFNLELIDFKTWGCCCLRILRFGSQRVQMCKL